MAAHFFHRRNKIKKVIATFYLTILDFLSFCIYLFGKKKSVKKNNKDSLHYNRLVDFSGLPWHFKLDVD